MQWMMVVSTLSLAGAVALCVVHAFAGKEKCLLLAKCLHLVWLVALTARHLF